MGELEFQQQNYRRAKKYLESAVTVLESLRPGLRDEQKISLADTQKHTYDLLQQTYIAQNKTDLALVTAERGRARAFIELLAQRNTDTELELDTAAPNVKEIKAIAKKPSGNLSQLFHH